MKLRKHKDLFLVGVLILVFIGQGLLSMVHKSLTYDEPAHVRFGEQILEGNSDRFDDSKMPITSLNVAIYRLAEQWFPALTETIWQPARIGRIATLMFASLVGLILYIWGREWGKSVGLLGLFLYVFEPNILAHSRLITTDIYLMGMVLFSVFTFRRFLDRPTIGRGVVAAIVLGVAQLTKYTAIFLFPIYLVLALIYDAYFYVQCFEQRQWGRIFQRLLKYFGIGLMFVIVAIFIINIGFLFNRSFLGLDDYAFRSSLFQSFQSRFAGFESIRIPVPYPYLEGLDWIVQRERTGDGYGPVYLFGELRDGEGFPGYFLIAMLYKVPIGLIIIFVFALVTYLRNFSWKEFCERDVFLILPWFFFTIYFNFFFRAQIGIRFILQSFPFILLFCGGLARRWNGWSLNRKVALSVLLASILISVSSYFPHYLSYFNELQPNRTEAYQILADSNLDWGQNKGNLAHFLASHPDYYYEPAIPTEGTVVISVNMLVGVRDGPDMFAWIYENLEPIGNFEYSYLVFEVSSADIEDYRLTR